MRIRTNKCCANCIIKNRNNNNEVKKNDFADNSKLANKISECKENISLSFSSAGKVKYIPENIGNLGKIVGEYVNAPEQKLFLATTALMIRPLIDLEFAQEDKQIDSAIKTASKAMAGGLTGVTIRAVSIAIINKILNIKKLSTNKNNVIKKYFIPQKIKNSYGENPIYAAHELKQYNNTIGTFLAVLFMISFSNAKIDVPLTSDIQDLLSKKVKENKSWKTAIKEVLRNRKSKIKNRLNQKANEIYEIPNKIKQRKANY